MNKFKIGMEVFFDRDIGGSKYLKDGNTYTIKSIDATGEFYLLEETEDRWFSIHNFKSLQKLRDEKIDQLLK